MTIPTEEILDQHGAEMRAAEREDAREPPLALNDDPRIILAMRWLRADLHSALRMLLGLDSEIVPKPQWTKPLAAEELTAAPKWTAAKGGG